MPNRLNALKDEIGATRFGHVSQDEQRIVCLHTGKDWSLDELAARLVQAGVDESYTSLSRIEHNEQTADSNKIASLARVFAVSADCLPLLTDDPRPRYLLVVVYQHIVSFFRSFSRGRASIFRYDVLMRDS